MQDMIGPCALIGEETLSVPLQFRDLGYYSVKVIILIRLNYPATVACLSRMCLITVLIYRNHIAR